MKEQKPSGKDTETRIIETLTTVIREEHSTTRTGGAKEQADTRQHISSEVGGIKSDTETTKTRMDQIKKMVRRLLNKMGIGTDDIT